jgi:hypothetical protein
MDENEEFEICGFKALFWTFPRGSQVEVAHSKLDKRGSANTSII